MSASGSISHYKFIDDGGRVGPQPFPKGCLLMTPKCLLDDWSDQDMNIKEIATLNDKNARKASRGNMPPRWWLGMIHEYVILSRWRLKKSSPVWLFPDEQDAISEADWNVGQLVAELRAAKGQPNTCWTIVEGDGWESPVVDLALVEDDAGRVGLMVVSNSLIGDYAD
jgi:hypothetical protein